MPTSVVGEFSDASLYHSASADESAEPFHVPSGNAEYLSRTVLPLLHDALEELGGVLVHERLQIATGELWDEDGYRPLDWTPVDPLQYLTDFFRRARLQLSRRRPRRCIRD